MKKREHDSKQSAARRIADERGPKLAASHPEIAELYRGGITLEEIAKKYLMDFNRSPKVSRTIVHMALCQLITDKSEKKKLALEHKMSGVTGEVFGPDTFRQVGRVLARLRGQEVLSDEQRQYIRDLALRPENRHERDQHGTTDYAKIFAEFRQTFPDARVSIATIRTEGSLAQRGLTRAEDKRLRREKKVREP